MSKLIFVTNSAVSARRLLSKRGVDDNKIDKDVLFVVNEADIKEAMELPSKTTRVTYATFAGQCMPPSDRATAGFDRRFETIAPSDAALFLSVPEI